MSELLYYGNPINWSHPRNVGLVSRWQAVPWWMGSYQCIDLAGVPKKNHGTLTSMALPGTATSGWGTTTRRGGRGELRFDGTNDYVSFPSVTPTDFTILCWFNGSDFDTANRVLFGNVSDSNTFTGFLAGAGAVYWRSASGTLRSFTLVTGIALNAWHRFVITRIGGVLRAYVDAIESVSGSISDSGTFTINQFGGYSTASLNWKGSLDNGSIHSRGYSPSEVRQDFFESQRRADPTLSWIERRVVFPSAVAAGSRIYFDSVTAAAVSPAFDAGWEDTTSATPLHWRLNTTPQGSVMSTLSFSDLSATDQDVLLGQWVSKPLSGAQTISAQAIQVAIRASETNVLNNDFLTLGIRVVSNDGSTVRGTILAVTRDDTELATSLTDRYFTATSSSVSAQDTDRIVIELGIGGAPTAVTHDGSIRVGDAGASDLPYDDSTTTDLNPFVQFAQTLVFGSEAAAGNRRRRFMIAAA